MATPDGSSSVLVRRSSPDIGIPCQNPNSGPNPVTLALRPSSSTSTLSSILTEERLRDHDRRPSNVTESPYYMGFSRLNDSYVYFPSLVLSPSRDSLASSARSSSSSVLLTIQEWTPFCFSKNSKKKEFGDGGEPPKMPDGPLAFPQAVSWDPGLYMSRGTDTRKPLRESDLIPAAPVAPVAVNVPMRLPEVAREVGKERDYVWAYKYRPKFLKEFICNRDRVEELQEMVRKQQCCHFIFEGPPGVGKRSMVLSFLRDLSGLEKLKTKNEVRKIELKGEHITSIDVSMRTSSQHVEVKLSELRGYEKHVIVSLINESRAPSNNTVQCDHSNCRAIVVHEAEKLSVDAQHYIRWIMEKYKGCNKIFFCCHDASKLQTINYLCKIVKLQQPSYSEIVEVLEFIARKEGIELPHHLAEKIAKNSKNNLRQSIRSFEASWKSNHSLKEDTVILTGWEDDIANMAISIVKEQSPKQLYIIRGKLKKLIEHDVSPDFIFNTLIVELKKLLNEQFQSKIDAMYQEYKIRDSGPILIPDTPVVSSLDRQLDSGDKNDQRRTIHYFMRIEEFTAKFMSFYKSFITNKVGAHC